MVGKSASELSKMGRRRFFSTLSSIGITGMALDHMTKDVLAKVTSNPEDEVPRLSRLRHRNPEEYKGTSLPDHEPEREPVYYTIPRDEWVAIEGAHNAARNVNRRLNALDDSGLVQAGVTEIVDGQRRKTVVEVDYITLKKLRGSENGERTYETKRPGISFQRLQDKLPDTASGQAPGESSQRVDVPVVSQQVEKTEHDYDGKYRPIPGGTALEAGDFSTGSMATPVWDSDRSAYRMLTAGHVVLHDADDSTCGSGDVSELYQPNVYWSGDSYFGTSDKACDLGSNESPSEFDAGTINATDAGISYQMAGSEAGTYDPPLIDGIIGWDEIKDKANSGYYLYMQGRNSGRASGEVTKTIPKNTYGYGNFNTTAGSDPGDSGGPHFKIYPYDRDDSAAYIAGVNCWGVENDDVFAGAVGIQRIEEHMNLSV